MPKPSRKRFQKWQENNIFLPFVDHMCLMFPSEIKSLIMERNGFLQNNVLLSAPAVMHQVIRLKASAIEIQILGFSNQQALQVLLPNRI